MSLAVNEVKYELSKKQQRVNDLLIDPDIIELALDGARDSGKTWIILKFIISILMRFPGARALTTRFRFVDCKNILWKQSMCDILKQDFGPEGTGYQINWADLICEFSNGSQIYGTGLDNKERAEKALGGKFCIIFPNEASQISYDSYQTVKGSLQQEIPGFANKLILDWNPRTKKSWQYMRFVLRKDEEGNAIRNKSIARIGPWLPTDNPSMTPQRLNTLNSLTGTAHKRFALGQYVEDVGLMYPNFGDALVDDFDIPDDWPIDTVTDFGFTNPFCIHWWAFDKSNETYYLFDEYYVAGKIVEDHCKLLKGKFDSRRPVANVCDHDAEDRKTMERHLDIKTTAAIKRDKPHSFDLVRCFLSAKKGIKLRIFRSVVNTIEEADGYEKKPGKEYKNAPEEANEVNNHGMDNLAYKSREVEKKHLKPVRKVVGFASIGQESKWNM